VKTDRRERQEDKYLKKDGPKSAAEGGNKRLGKKKVIGEKGEKA